MSITYLWWIFPLLMIVLCFFMMSGRVGMMCGRGHHEDSLHLGGPGSARDILDKLYALGKISREEYEEKREALNQRS